MEFLLDLLVLPEGPRLRDKVSHGEVNLDEDMSNSVFRMCIYIIIASYNDLSRYLSPSSEEDTRASSSLSDYRALFHPKRYVLLSKGEFNNYVDRILPVFEKLISDCSLFCSPNTFCSYFQGRNCHCQVF
jgi:hypothetical protein